MLELDWTHKLVVFDTRLWVHPSNLVPQLVIDCCQAVAPGSCSTGCLTAGAATSSGPGSSYQ